MTRLLTRAAWIPALALLSLPLALNAQTITVPKDTDVTLAFDQSLSSKTAKPGDTVRLHVVNDVSVGGTTVLKAGTPVTGSITKVDKRGRYGVNAKIRIALSPVRSVEGTMIPLEAKGKGKQLKGSRTDHAAEATAAGAVVLGPVGLVAGYFIPGKPVTIHPGDPLVTTIPQDIVISRR